MTSTSALNRGAFLHDVGKIGVPDAVTARADPQGRRCLRCPDDRETVQTALAPDHALRELREEAAKGWKFEGLGPTSANVAAKVNDLILRGSVYERHRFDAGAAGSDKGSAAFRPNSPG
jgi:hypothetical protein